MVEGEKMADHNTYAKRFQWVSRQSSGIAGWLIELLVQSAGPHTGFAVSKLHYKQTTCSVLAS